MEFKHEPVLLREVLQWLDPAPGGIFADGTLGGGGHSERILERIGNAGCLYGIDRDEDALQAASERLQQAGYKLAEIVYSDQQDQTAPGAGNPGDGGDDVVDADYEVVD